MVFRKLIACSFFLSLVLTFAADVSAQATGKDLMSPDPEVAVLDTTMGQIIVGFYPNAAPKHVENFKSLAKKGFYDGSLFHRVLPNFMIQGGDPLTKDKDRSNDGTGDAGYTIKAEFNNIPHKRGILSMARSQDPDSASSQFFIMVADYPSLDHKYSAFGYVIKGMGVVDKIVHTRRDSNDNPTSPMMIKKVTIEKASEHPAGATND